MSARVDFSLCVYRKCARRRLARRLAVPLRNARTIGRRSDDDARLRIRRHSSAGVLHDRRARSARIRSAARWSTARFPAYVPVIRGGGKMHVRMLCLGRHWNGRTYSTSRRAATSTGWRRRQFPATSGRVAHDIAAAADMSVDPDVCILNYYDGDGRMGLHQDKDEGPRSIADGLAGRLGVDWRHRAVSVRRAYAGGIRSRRFSCNRAMRSSSAARRGFGSTAYRGSCRNRRRPSSR